MSFLFPVILASWQKGVIAAFVLIPIAGAVTLTLWWFLSKKKKGNEWFPSISLVTNVLQLNLHLFQEQRLVGVRLQEMAKYNFKKTKNLLKNAGWLKLSCKCAEVFQVYWAEWEHLTNGAGKALVKQRLLEIGQNCTVLMQS